MAEDARLLRTIPVFRGVTDTDFVPLMNVLRHAALKAGEVLCREGEATDCAYFITQGEAQVLKRTAQGDDQVLAVLAAPCVVGEMGLVDRQPRAATLRINKPSDVYVLAIKDFDALRAGGSRGAYRVLNNIALLLCDRLRETNDKIQQFFANPEKSLNEMKARQNVLMAKRGASR